MQQQQQQQYERPPGITVTGVDVFTPVLDLIELSKRAEIGFLYRETSIPRETRGFRYLNPPEPPDYRYPGWGWIREVSLEMHSAALHVCGAFALKQIVEGSRPMSSFQRIQLNGHIDNETLSLVCSMYPRHTIITQYNESNRHLRDFYAENHAVLVDDSGGCAKLPDEWVDADPPVGMMRASGFAGGLGPDNLARELPSIEAASHQGWWVDMEGKLRVDGRFSIAAAQTCVSIFQNYIRGS